MSRFLSTVSHRYALAVVLLLVLGGAAATFRRGPVAAPSPTGTTAVEAAGTPLDDAQSDRAILLGLARDAMRDGRLIAPAGSNAFEFYLSVLQLEPHDRTAHEALRESFGRASEEIERTINRNELEEARREIDLLREFDSNNFTLSLLGGKLSAARNILTRQHEAEAERIRQANAMRGAAM
ncbi:energy transducer TonB [Rhodanobacter sp. UC4450_H17]|jgi:protein TonB|nr:energy transducer TonB [Rhodanobacter sp.]